MAIENIANDLQALINGKRDMKNALIEKNSIPSGGVVTYADAIRAISTESNFNCRVEYPQDLSDISITMGGVDITEEVMSGNIGSIDKITGDLVIIISEKMFIIYTLSNVTSSNNKQSVSKNSHYTTTLSIEEGYEFSDVTIVMGEVDITDSVFDVLSGIVDIPSVTNNLTIEASAALKRFNVTNIIPNASNSNAIDTIEYGSAYNATITADEGYELLAVSATMGGEPIAVNSNIISISKVTGDINIEAIAVKISYTVTNNLTLVSNNNVADSINYGDSYSATLVADNGYKLNNVNVTMGGVPIVVVNGVINIAKVTGNIVITADAVIAALNITNVLTNVATNNAALTIEYNEPYTATLSPSEYYDLGDVSVVMGGVDITNSVYSNGSINIPNVTADVTITANGVIKIASITTNFTNVASNNSAVSVEYGSTYSATLTSENKNWTVQNIVVIMNGVDVTNSVVVNNTITIPSVNGDISISAVASNKVLGTVEETNNVISINDGELTSGTYTMRYEDADGNPIANMDDITTFTI